VVSHVTPGTGDNCKCWFYITAILVQSMVPVSNTAPATNQ
jgi:hypothetical protein